jgi:flagellar hook-basal body complex protein FliE
MIAMSRASVSFQALVQTRNRFVQAYQDIMNMQV